MPPFPQSQASPADTRFLEPRQIDRLISFEPNILDKRSELPESTQHDLTLSLLLSKRGQSPPAQPAYDGALQERQTYIRYIPTVYQGLNDGPAPGTVVGIVLGSVAGFLILIWLLWLVSNGSGTLIRTEGDVEEIDVVRRRSRSPRTRRTRSRRPEMSVRDSPARRVVRKERIVRDFGPDRSPSPSVVRDRSRVRETVIVEETRPERRFDGDDEVVVIEEHSELSPRRERRRRESGSYRSVTEEHVRERIVETRRDDDEDRIAGSYRVVDPRQAGGGSFRPHRMR